MAGRTKKDSTSKLTPFDGSTVLSVGIAVTGAGDGLSEALAVDPVEYHLGEIVHVVLECEVAKVRFDPVKDSNGVRRVHFFKAGNATIVDGSLVADALESQQRRIEEAAGVHRLELGDELSRQHEAGDHAEGVVEGCPACDEEVELAAAGK